MTGSDVRQDSADIGAVTTRPTGVSVFDLDGTLTRRDTYLAYLLGYLRRTPRRWSRVPSLAVAVCLFYAGFKDNTWLKTTFLAAVLGGLGRDQLGPWTDAFVSRLTAKGLRPRGLAKLQERRASGDVLVLASASPDLYVEPLARRLGFDHTICTRLGWSAERRLTGRLEGGNCHGLEKKRRVESWRRTAGIEGPLRVYTDHHADLPLLLIADHPRAICPTAGLRREAERKAIPIERWD